MIEGATFRIVAAGVPLSFVLTAGMVVAVPQGAPLRREPHQTDPSVAAAVYVRLGGYLLTRRKSTLGGRRPSESCRRLG